MTAAGLTLQDQEAEASIEPVTSVPTITRFRGTVKWYNSETQIGAITIDNTGEEVFVHRKCIRTADSALLLRGELVEFDLDGKGNCVAHNVTKL